MSKPDKKVASSSNCNSFNAAQSPLDTIPLGLTAATNGEIWVMGAPVTYIEVGALP